MEFRKLDDLKKLDNNPRTIKKDDFERLKKSIEDNADYFEARPLILSDRTGELVIIAGNQRYEAARALNMTKVPTFLLSGLTKEREDEIIIRDNVANGEFDWDMLANEWDIEKLNEWGVNNIKKTIQDEKELEKEKPIIITSFVTFEYTDEISLGITDEIAEKLMAEMIAYKKDHGDYEGFWDERLQ